MDRWQTITDFAITKGELMKPTIVLKTQ